MKTILGWCAAATLLCLQCVNATAQKSPAQFDEPVRLKAGDAFMGDKRLYPSPVVHDVDGDGVPDVVVGDLRGLLTVAPGERTASGIRFGAEKPILDHEGKDLKFHNW